MVISQAFRCRFEPGHAFDASAVAQGSPWLPKSNLTLGHCKGLKSFIEQGQPKALSMVDLLKMHKKQCEKNVRCQQEIYEIH